LRQYRKCVKDLRTGSWIVLSLYKPGAIKCHCITATQESRWRGKGFLEKMVHVVFYSYRKKSQMFETGFIVSKKRKHLIIDFDAKPHRTWRL
jgi:hypothetical protein